MSNKKILEVEMEHAKDIDNIRLVRTQDALYGMRLNENGDLLLHRDEREFNRNSTHFSVNGPVGNHAYGTFNGQIAIIADPREMGVPSGFGQADVWFQNDSKKNLNVGRAVLVAPIGTDIPRGVKAVFYDPKVLDARDDAVNAHLSSIGIDPKKFSMWGWVGDSMHAHGEWQEKTAGALYGNKAEKVQFTPHSGSLDESVDDAVNACEGLLACARKDYLHVTDSKVEVPYTETIKTMIAVAHQNIAKFKNRSSTEVIENASFYLDGLSQKLSDYEKENLSIERKYDSPFFIRDPSSGQSGKAIGYDQVLKMIELAAIDPKSKIKNICVSDEWQDIKAEFSQAKWPEPVSAAPALAGMVPPPLPMQSVQIPHSPPPPPPIHPIATPPLRSPASMASLGARINFLLKPSESNRRTPSISPK
jgi:hypothetical protein